MNPIKTQVRETSTAGLSAGLWATLSSVESSGLAYYLWSVLKKFKHFAGMELTEEDTHSLWHVWNDRDSFTRSTINHDSLPAVGEELSTNGQHTATYINRFQFEYETTVTYSVEGCTKVVLHCISAAQTFNMAAQTFKWSSWQRNMLIAKLGSLRETNFSYTLDRMGGYWYGSVVFPIKEWSALGNGRYISRPPTHRKRS